MRGVEVHQESMFSYRTRVPIGDRAAATLNNPTTKESFVPITLEREEIASRCNSD